MCARKDEDRLIRIGQQDLLILTLGPRVKPDDGLLPLFDLFYRSASICPHRDPNLISKCRNVTHCPASFQLAAQLANNKALPGLHCKETRLGFDDQSLQCFFVRQMFYPIGSIRAKPLIEQSGYGSSVSVGIPPSGVGVSVTPKLDSNQYKLRGSP